MGYVLHIDGDSFFASVEASLNPALRNKPVVTGHERGIATAMSKEAKALGVHRGMPIFKIKKEFPQVIIVRSDYHHYSIFSQRMVNIVRRYAERVQEYSIDECFGLVSGPEAARRIKADLQKELGMTFSLGLAPTKVLAKVASKWNKPDGFTVLNKSDIEDFLREMAVGKVWGIGPATSANLQKMGIKTALDYINRPLDWVRAHLDKHELELWHELRGETVYRIHEDAREQQKSIQQTRTFPKTTDKKFIWSELSKNVEGACQNAREQGLVAKRIYYFLKTQEFRYHRSEIILNEPTQTPTEVLRQIKTTFDTTYKLKTPYRASGVTLAGLIPEEFGQNGLFAKNDKNAEIYKTVDALDRRYGEHTIILGSSMSALRGRGIRSGHDTRRFRIPSMGECS